MGGAKRRRGWSATGGARFARDARIATAAFLRDAPAAREWTKSKLEGSYRANVVSLRSQGVPPRVAEAGARSIVMTGLGYPTGWSLGWDELTERVVADEARCLAAADLYVLSPQMTDVVVAAAQSLTIDDVALMTAEDLPSPTGLLVLPQPLLVRAVNGGLGDDRAYLWHTPAELATPNLTGTQIARLERDPETLADADWTVQPAVRISTYHDSHGPVRPDSFLAFAAAARKSGYPLPPLLGDSIRCTPFEQPVTDEQRATLDTFAHAARTTGALDRAAERAAGLDDERVDEGRMTGEYVPGAEIVDEHDTFQRRFLYAFWRLCEQQIATTRVAEAGHAARLTAERAGVTADVRVVQLRTTSAAATQPATDPTTDRWHHRWVVRMHKVRQWYPSEQRHKVIYRGPYLKGPEGKPLLGGDVVRNLPCPG